MGWGRKKSAAPAPTGGGGSVESPRNVKESPRAAPGPSSAAQPNAETARVSATRKRTEQPAELERLVCGDALGAPWSERELAAAIVADHGYHRSSRAIRRLVAILAAFDAAERRAFVRFVTGAPRLPTGGLQALAPPLTVVRKEPDPWARAAGGGAASPDAYLPSVMTCANFLKLPDYSSHEVMRERLLLSMREGQSAFLLS